MYVQDNDMVHQTLGFSNFNKNTKYSTKQILNLRNKTYVCACVYIQINAYKWPKYNKQSNVASGSLESSTVAQKIR
jgi:hypothetical protein